MYQYVGNLYTWKSPGDIIPNQIDYIMINNRHKNSVMNVKTYPGADAASDHNPVMMKIRVKLKRKLKSKYEEQYDWNMPKDMQIREKYNIEVYNRFQSLNVEDTQNLEYVCMYVCIMNVFKGYTLSDKICYQQVSFLNIQLHPRLYQKVS